MLAMSCKIFGQSVCVSHSISLKSQDVSNHKRIFESLNEILKDVLVEKRIDETKQKSHQVFASVFDIVF